MGFLGDQVSYGPPVESTYVPLPYQELMAVGQMKQSDFDRNQAALDKLSGLMTDLSPRPQEVGAAKAIVDPFAKEIESLYKPGVDLGSSEIANKIRKLAVDWGSNQNIKTIKANKEAWDTYQTLKAQGKLEGFEPDKWKANITDPSQLENINFGDFIHKQDLNAYFNELQLDQIKPTSNEVLEWYKTTDPNAKLQDGVIYLPSLKTTVSLTDANTEFQKNAILNNVVAGVEGKDPRALYFWEVMKKDKNKANNYITNLIRPKSQEDVKLQLLGGSDTLSGKQNSKENVVNNFNTTTKTIGVDPIFSGDPFSEILQAENKLTEKRTSIDSDLRNLATNFIQEINNSGSNIETSKLPIQATKNSEGLLVIPSYDPEVYKSLTPEQQRSYDGKLTLARTKVNKHNSDILNTQNLIAINNAAMDQALEQVNAETGGNYSFTEMNDNMKEKAQNKYYKSFVTQGIDFGIPELNKFKKDIKDVLHSVGITLTDIALENVGKPQSYKEQYETLKPFLKLTRDYQRMSDEEFKETYNREKKFIGTILAPAMNAFHNIEEAEKKAEKETLEYLSKENPLYGRYYQIISHLNDVQMVDINATMLPDNIDDKNLSKKVGAVKEEVVGKLLTDSNIRNALNNKIIQLEDLESLRTHLNTDSKTVENIKSKLSIAYRFDPDKPGKIVLDVIVPGFSITSEEGKTATRFELDSDNELLWEYIRSSDPATYEAVKLAEFYQGFKNKRIESTLQENIGGGLAKLTFKKSLSTGDNSPTEYYTYYGNGDESFLKRKFSSDKEVLDFFTAHKIFLKEENIDVKKSILRGMGFESKAVDYIINNENKLFPAGK